VSETPRPEAGIVFGAGGNEVGIRRRATPARYALRLAVGVAYVGALVLALQLSGFGGGVADEPAQAEPVAVAPAEKAPPERPAAVPKRIPAWAWATYRWHDDRSGVRPPDAPPTLPAWYWEWRAWKAEVDP
jgi:hypothetical protein